MIDRYEEDNIANVVIGQVVIYFYFDHKTDEEDRKLAMKIFRNPDNVKFAAKELLTQLHDELKITCRTELVKQVFVDVSNIYSADKDEIDVDFYTDYLVQKERIEDSNMWIYYGFVCPETIGRYSRKLKQFTEVSNSMLSSCGLM